MMSIAHNLIALKLACFNHLSSDKKISLPHIPATLVVAWLLLIALMSPLTGFAQSTFSPPTANAFGVNVLENSSANTIPSQTTGIVSAVQITTPPAHGTLVVSGLNFVYTPTSNYYGADSFFYTASNGAGVSTPARVSITITQIIPTANAVNATIIVNSINNLINPNITGSPDSIAINSAPAHGSVNITGLDIIYTPNAGYIGSDVFSYTASNTGGTSTPANVSITINGIPPSANSVDTTVQENSSTNSIASNTTGNATSIALLSAPSHGVASISGLNILYTPSPGFVGSDNLTYTASNAFGTSSAANITINVKPIPPVANNITAEVLQNSSNNAINSSTSGSINSITLSSIPTHGTVNINGNNFSYTPTKDYIGSDSFSYAALNASGSSNVATVSINVKATAPVAMPFSTVLEINQTNVPIRPTVVGSVDRITLDSAASHGTVNISGLEFLYTPAVNYVGTDSFTYIAINAAGSSSPATVSITVKAKAPVVSNANIQVLAGSAASLELANLVSQVSGAPVSFSILTQPAHGSATLNGTRLTVNAHLNYAGADQLSIVANANGLASNTAVISITVTARPDPSKNPAVQALQTSKAAIINQFERLQLENFNARLTEIATQNSGLRSKEDKKKNEDACNKVTLWAGGLNSFSTIAADYEIKQQNGGASFGGDRCLGSPDSVLGFGVGYANSRGELRGLNTTINANARNIANYGQFKPLPFFNFSWVLGINDINSDYTRSTEQINDSMGWALPPVGIMNGAPSNTTQHAGKWSGRQKLGSTSLGFDVTFTDFKISPYLRLDRSAVTIAAYSESGDARSALRYQEQSFNSQRTTFGMNAETVTKTRFGELTPRLRLEYQKDVSKRDDIKINYVDNPDSTPYIINGSKQNRNLIHMGIGGDLLLDSGWVIIFNYGYYRASEGNHSNAIRLRLSYRL